MLPTDLIAKIAAKDFELEHFVQLALDDPQARDEIVCQMLTNPAIMVYYHCYYVVEKASREQPALFYRYWDDIAALLSHPNSYQRDFAVEIIGNLAQVDQENRFAGLAEAYFGILNDEKFMTGNCCLKNLLKIYRYKAGQRARVMNTLLEIDLRCDYIPKQKAVLKADVLAIFDEIYFETPEQERINAFIRAEISSPSPKTRRKARELVKKYHLA